MTNIAKYWLNLTTIYLKRYIERYILRAIVLFLGDILFPVSIISFPLCDMSFLPRDISFLLCNISFPLSEIQYCAKVMRAKFVELRCFSVVFNGIQRIFERNGMSTKYSRNFMPSIVLTQSKLSGRATKSCSACSEFLNEDNEFSF